MLRIIIALSVAFLIADTAYSQGGLSLKEREEQKAREEEEARERARAALEQLNRTIEGRKKDNDNSDEPRFVKSTIWVAKEDCDPAAPPAGRERITVRRR